MNTDAINAALDSFYRNKSVFMDTSKKPYKGELIGWKLHADGGVIGILMYVGSEHRAMVITTPIVSMQEGLLETENSLYGLC